MKKLNIIFFVFTIHCSLIASTKTSIANGDWFNPSIWNPIGVPNLEDSVIINSNVTFNVNLDARFSAKKAFIVNLNASIKSIGMDDSLTLGDVNYLINNGEIHAAEITWGNISVFMKNTGIIKSAGTIGDSDLFYNESGGLIQVGENLITSGTFNNKSGGIITTFGLYTSDSFTNNGDITTDEWVNGATVFGTTGKYCIANTFINTYTINGSSDICDATPGILPDANMGTISASITNCAKGPCASSITNINEFNHTKVEIYPNPASNYLTINLNKNTLTDYEISNVLGEIIYKSFGTNHSENLKINVNPFLNGIYFLKIKYEKESTTIKFIKE